MIAHKVTLHLKPGRVAEFTQIIETAIIPLLRKQQGFHDEIAFVVPDGTDAVSVSLWDQQTHADAYRRGAYPAVLKALAGVLEGTPKVRTYEVSNSTFHRLIARNTI